MLILVFLGFPLKIGMDRFYSAVVVHQNPAPERTQNIHITSTRSCFCSRNIFARLEVDF